MTADTTTPAPTATATPAAYVANQNARAFLALRRSASSSAGWLARLACWLIRVRLASVWCHGGVVVDGTLLHATATHGLCRVLGDAWEPHKWDLFALPDSSADAIVQRYRDAYPAQYDWFSLLAFVLPGRWRDARRLYCFEWCSLALTGTRPTSRVTPDMLLAMVQALHVAAGTVAPPPPPTPAPTPPQTPPEPAP